MRKNFKIVAKHIFRLPGFLAAGLISLYQKSFSPDHSFWAKSKYPHGFCRFYPTCSEYGRQAFLKHGLIRGGIYSFFRLFRCHPWSLPKIDLVP